MSAVFGVGVVLTIGAWTWTLAPWWAPPEGSEAAIDGRWETIEGWARPRLPAGTPVALFGVQAAIEAGDVEGAATRILEWDHDGGGLGEDPCIDDRISVFALLDASKVAVARADRPDAPSIAATLRLGAALRDRGPTIASLVGIALYKIVLARHVREGWTVTPLLEELRPRRGEIMPMVAREAVCAVEWIDGGLADGSLDPRELAEGRFERMIAALGVDRARERQHLRAYLGERVERALAAQSPADVAAALDAPPREQRPASLATREVAGFLGASIEGIEVCLDEIDATLADLESRS
ncbi:MAG: hypothetical protein R3B09_34915 [Nannocystaceae bacterium]